MKRFSKDYINNTEDFIFPNRFIPFDIGISVDELNRKNIELFLRSRDYQIQPVPELLSSFSMDIMFKVTISPAIRLYIFSYGIGVFVIEDNLFKMGELYATQYCNDRKQIHNKILNFKYGKISEIIDVTITGIRNAVNPEKKNRRRRSGYSNWEYNGLSYIMTVSYLIKKEKGRHDYDKFSDIEKKNLHIMLEPSIAKLEDSQLMFETKEEIDSFDPYNFFLEEMEPPIDWVKSEEVAIYISWAAVVVYLNGLLSKYYDLIEYLEVDLQAMWLLTYCLYDDIKNCPHDEKKSVSRLKKDKFSFQRRYNEFESRSDTSMPAYISRIRNELINTSGVKTERDKYVEYLDYCIEETKSAEEEKKTKYAVLSEILLFIIAFFEVAPQIYEISNGSLDEVNWVKVGLLAICAIIGIVFIIRKD